MGVDTWWLVVLLGSVVLVLAGGSDTDHQDHGNHGNAHDDKGHGDVTGHKSSGKVFATGRQHAWSYNIQPNVLGPDKWNTLFPKDCGSVKKLQSPINIVTSETKYVETLDDVDILSKEVHADTPVPQPEALPTVKPEPTTKVELESEGKLEDGDMKDHSNHGEMMADGGPADVGETPSDSGMYLINNGHTVKVIVDRAVYVMGAGLGDQYKVAQFHFHWGNNGSVGSEHRIDGNMFMLEMHVVTFDNERYANLAEAVGQENGIAVFSTLFTKGKHNDNLNTVVNNLKKVPAPDGGKKVAIEWIDLRSVLPVKTDRYYRYQGSLTTPYCSQTVRWTVFADHPTVCPHQMMQFYKLSEGYYADGSPVRLVNNLRPPQPLNGRTIFSSFPAGSDHLVEYTIKGEENGDPYINSSPKLTLSAGIITMVAVCMATLRDSL